MSKSFCIKTNNKEIINYLLNQFENMNLNNTYISTLKFKFYNNIVIHYTGNNIKLFTRKVAHILSKIIINFYEINIIKKIINSNYFYFTQVEQETILNMCSNTLYISPSNEFKNREILVYSSLFNYIYENKNLLIDGFVNFRLFEYVKLLDLVIDSAVNKFVIDKEYHQFIDSLKSYINSKNSCCELVHIIYDKHNSILLDDSKNIIPINNSILNNKYVSDITFSSNDYTLNTLLTILPSKIYMHIIDEEDEFISTLKQVFSGRISICTDCDICKAFRFEIKNNKCEV